MKRRLTTWIGTGILVTTTLVSTISTSSIYTAQEISASEETSDNSDTEKRGNNTMVGRGNGGNRGGGIVENSALAQAVIDQTADQFQQFNYIDEESGISLEYSLYIPRDYDENESYPLVMYIPDSTGSGKSAQEIVEQYYGANAFASEADQKKHASFVFVPAFSETVVDDNHNTSDQIEAAVKALNSLTLTYSIDPNRLYTTGQSMGCMTSLYLNSKYPDLFAASIYVSGQWDISVLQGMETQTFFYIVAGGDSKASAGQQEVMDMFDADSAIYSYGEWNAQEDLEEQNARAEALISEGNNANMIRFETGTVLTGQTTMEHMASFNYAYQLDAVRDWLFTQSK